MFEKRHCWVLLCLLWAVCFSGCWKRKEVLHLYCWADYVSPDLIKAFEKEHNCRVVYDTFDSNEQMYAKLKAGATGYDVIVPSHYIVELMVKDQMLLALDKSQLPNLQYLDDSIVAMMPDSECRYSVPYMMFIRGSVSTNRKSQTFSPLGALLERADLKGRMTMLDDAAEVIGAALLVLGHDPNTPMLLYSKKPAR